MKPFEYLDASSVEEVCLLLSQHQGQARVIAGGTDLLVSMRRKIIEPEYVINLGNIPNLKYIRHAGGDGFRIGALTTLRDVEKSPMIKQRFPLLADAVSRMANPSIRNMATVGGNLCNAAPSADTAPPLIALGAKLKAETIHQERVINLEGFFLGPGNTVLQVGELVTEIQIEGMPSHTKGTYLKMGRTAVDIALVGVAVVVTLDSNHNGIVDAKIVLGAVAPIPMRAKRTEDIVRGKSMADEEWIEAAAQIAAEEARPISDVRASAEYRREMTKVLVGQALRQVLTST